MWNQFIVFLFLEITRRLDLSKNSMDRFFSPTLIGFFFHVFPFFYQRNRYNKVDITGALPDYLGVDHLSLM